MFPVSFNCVPCPIFPSKGEDQPSTLTERIKGIWSDVQDLIPNLFTRQMAWGLALSGKAVEPVVQSADRGISALDYLLALVRSVSSAVGEFFLTSRLVARILSMTKLVSGAYVPFSLVHLVQTAKKLGEGGSADVMTDRALKFTSYLASIGEGISNPLIGLTELGVLPAAVATVATPLLGVSAILSLVVGVIHAKEGWQNYRFLQQLEQARGVIDETSTEPQIVRALHDYHKLDTRTLRKRLSLAKSEMGPIHQTLEKMQTEPNLDKKREVTVLLDKRVRKTFTMKKVSVVANLCMLIGIVTFVVCPFNPVGDGLIALGILLGIATLIAIKVQNHRFHKQWNVLS